MRLMTLGYSNIKEKTLFAAKWSILTEVLSKLVSPLTTMILARLLVPEEFGVIVTVVMVISFVEMFTDAGFQKYLIQYDFESEIELYRSTTVAFWSNLFLSFMFWVTISVFSNQIATIIGNPDLGLVITIACVQLPLTAFSSIQMALFRRNFDFKTLFFIRIFSISVPFIITIPLAILGFSYWSLIIGAICGQISNVIIMTIKSSWKPNFYYSFTILKKMFSFSVWSLVEGVSIWLTSWIDIFIIGSVLPTRFLGIFKNSTTLVNSFMALVTTSTIPILFSTLSRLQKNELYFKSTFLKAQKYISIIVLPLGIGVFVYRDLVTNILLGPDWNEASNVIGHWALTSSLVIIFGHLCSEAYRAKGKPKLSFIAQLLHLIVLIPVCLISVKYGFWALVYARSWVRMQSILIHLLFMKFIIGISPFEMFKNVTPLLLITIIVGAVGFFINNLNEGLYWEFFSLLIYISLYSVLIFSVSNIRRDIIWAVKIFMKKEKLA
jgi:O-antigen/teichoic acid export membrane protein